MPPWRSTYPKKPVAGMYSNPGPNKYFVKAGFGAKGTDGKDRNPTLYESPAYSIGMAYSKNIDKTPGPGPAYKPDPKDTCRGRDGGPYAFASWKAKDPRPHKGPGPTDYDTMGIQNHAWSKLKGVPAAALLSRHKGAKAGSGGPGPAYNIDKPTLDKMLHRSREAVISGPGDPKGKFTPPGPYPSIPTHKYMKGTPQSSTIAPRMRDPLAKKTPGPYSTQSAIDRTKKEAPAFSFGNHHSVFSPNVVTSLDMDGDCEVCVRDDYCRDTGPGKPADCPAGPCGARGGAGDGAGSSGDTAAGVGGGGGDRKS